MTVLVGEERTIAITGGWVDEDGNYLRTEPWEVSAIVYGCVAVHQTLVLITQDEHGNLITITSDAQYTITHLPTGFACMQDVTLEHAHKIAAAWGDCEQFAQIRNIDDWLRDVPTLMPTLKALAESAVREGEHEC